MNREELDMLWFQAMRQSIEEGEDFIRYHFAKLVAAHEREACCKIVHGQCESDNVAQRTVDAIRARGQEVQP
jgi:hypothetical protein